MNDKHPHSHVPAVLKPLRLLDTGLRKAEMSVLVVILLVMIGLSFAQVVLRGLQHAGLGQPVPWFEDLDRHFVLWVGMLGASIAAREGRHFGVEALPKMFSETGRRRLESALNLIAALVCALLTYIMWQDIWLDEIPRSREHHLFVLEAIKVANEDGKGSHPFQVERWWLLAIIPVGLVGMTFRFLLRSFEAAILSNEQWHWLERELKPDVVAAAQPGAEPASLGSGAVVATATPPATQRFQEAQAIRASERLEQGLDPVTRHVPVPGKTAPDSPATAPPSAPSAASPAPPAGTPAPEPSPKKTPTGRVKAIRLGDQGDISDPEARPSDMPPPDEEESLVDSDVLMSERPPDEESGTAPTDRQNKQPESGEERKP